MARTNGRHFSVQSTVEGKPVRLLVDTGAQFTSLAPGIVKFGHMLYNRDVGSSIGHLAVNSMQMSMVNGSVNGYPARLDGWLIGGYAVKSSVVLVQPLPPEILKEQSSGDGPVLGMLGADDLAANSAFIDIANSCLYLKPRQK
jgi:hypothetical protein